MAVFNDLIEQAWSVKATVVGNIVTADNTANTTFDVDTFKIGETLVRGTGADGIIFKSEGTPTAQNNTGELSKALSSAEISFTDKDNVLKVGNNLQGKISYQLYNTVDAK